jgi:hypothetical protein
VNTAPGMIVGTGHQHKPGGILFGRFMLPDSTEHPCQVTQLTPDGAVFLTSIAPPVGIGIVVYIDEIGRLEAVTGLSADGGFAVTFQISPPRRERIEARIRSLQIPTADEEWHRSDPRHGLADAASHIALSDGRSYACQVLDVSTSGAAIKTDVIPALGTCVLLGKMRGRVVRYTECGVAIEFTKQLDSGSQVPNPGALNFAT